MQRGIMFRTKWCQVIRENVPGSKRLGRTARSYSAFSSGGYDVVELLVLDVEQHFLLI